MGEVKPVNIWMEEGLKRLKVPRDILKPLNLDMGQFKSLLEAADFYSTDSSPLLDSFDADEDGVVKLIWDSEGLQFEEHFSEAAIKEALIDPEGSIYIVGQSPENAPELCVLKLFYKKQFERGEIEEMVE